MKHCLLVSALCLLMITDSIAAPAKNTGPCQEPNVSGTFYPSSGQELRRMIEGFLEKAPREPALGRMSGLISPHAGYVYSGPVAAYGYRRIQGQNYKTVVILAPSHYQPIKTAALYPAGSFRTPLGEVAVDEDFVKNLMQVEPDFRAMPEAFGREHGLEVQIPFLQVALKNFMIVPILLNTDSAQQCSALATGLAKVIGTRQDVLCIASTDLSHYFTQKQAQAKDAATLKLIQAGDAEGLLRAIASNQAEMCGSAAVATLLMTMKQLGITQMQVLHQATSYDTAGLDKDRVVGYASIVCYQESSESKATKGEKNMYSQEQRTTMLQTARSSIETFLASRQRLELKNSDPGLQEKRGAFVTLEKSGNLRGCIGRIVADAPLLSVIRDMAIEAATADPRFPPVRPDELKDITLEISVLTPFQEISSVDEIEVGRDGLMIRKGFNSGLLLPQVATEYGWNREEFLRQTCRKAGLAADAWQKDAQIYRFSAEVFGEH